MIETRDVTATIHDQTGAPLVGATVTARLDRLELAAASGYVVPTSTSAITDENGVAVLPLWPNALGSTESKYRIISLHPISGRKMLDIEATIPDSDCNLLDVAYLPPYKGKTVGEIAADNVAVYAAQASVSAENAAAFALATAADVVTTGLAATATEADREQTGLDAIAANTAASNAAVSENNAAASAAAAAADAAGFFFVQALPVAVWTITHDLDRYPSVVVIDSAGSLMEGEVKYLDQNTVSVTFSAPFSGTVQLN